MGVSPALTVLPRQSLNKLLGYVKKIVVYKLITGCDLTTTRAAFCNFHMKGLKSPEACLVFPPEMAGRQTDDTGGGMSQEYVALVS